MVRRLARRRWSAPSARPSRKVTCAPTPTPSRCCSRSHGLILALHHDARFLRKPGALDRARRLSGFDDSLVAGATANAGMATPRRA
jgi:hypothetical protein